MALKSTLGGNGNGLKLGGHFHFPLYYNNSINLSKLVNPKYIYFIAHLILHIFIEEYELRIVSIKYVAEVEISLEFAILCKILRFPIFGTIFLKFGKGVNTIGLF